MGTFLNPRLNDVKYVFNPLKGINMKYFLKTYKCPPSFIFIKLDTGDDSHRFVPNLNMGMYER